MTNTRRVVGIYGIPGSGKTFLLNQLKDKLPAERFDFFEGSELIASIVPGGLQAFKALDEQEKVEWRQLAIEEVATADHAGEKVSVVSGHCMFWNEVDDVGTTVTTPADLRTYKHIVYLDFPANIVAKRRKDDGSRSRPENSISHLSRWQQKEKAELQQLCYENGILFSVIGDDSQACDQISRFLTDFRCHAEVQNRSTTRAELDRVLAARGGQWKTIVVMDADRTLTAADTGELFWNEVVKKWPSRTLRSSLKEVFGSKLKYSHTAFVQAMLLYEETVNDEEYIDTCTAVASVTIVHPEFVSLLQAMAEQDDLGAVVITCGLRQVWETVLERHGLSDKVKVIGAGRLANGYVVTSNTKADLVSRMSQHHNAHVCAFGDSPLDLDMLRASDQAIVVVGEESTRSKSMDGALQVAVEHDGFRAYQVVLPSTASPRLNSDTLPILRLTDAETVQNVLRLHPSRTKIDIAHATSRNAAKLLMTEMRDANVAGPSLRATHQRVGQYLATEYLADINGVEEFPILHVQGHQVAGYRLLHEQETLIVPLMRGGEPMAFGVNDVLPAAMFLHAGRPEDIRHEHIQGQLCIILIDSVINTGKSLLEFVRHIRNMHATIRIVTMAGVVQKDAVARLSEEACCRLNFKLIALRLSDNKFTGKGATDTGNRLFNTPHLD